MSHSEYSSTEEDYDEQLADQGEYSGDDNVRDEDDLRNEDDLEARCKEEVSVWITGKFS